MRHLPIVCVSVLACLANTACNAQKTPGNEGKSISSDGTIAALTASELSLAERARAVVADTYKLPVSTITVDSVRAVEWRDSSIGCPQPGQAYGQVITPGHKITVRTEDGAIHVVHAANGRVFVCQRKKAPAQLSPAMELVWGPQAAIARADLARHLGVPPGKIIIANAAQKVWFDLSLGCPEADKPYAKARVEGYVLTLRHGSRDYTYHTDLDRVIACPAFSNE